MFPMTSATEIQKPICRGVEGEVGEERTRKVMTDPRHLKRTLGRNRHPPGSSTASLYGPIAGQEKIEI